MNKKELWLRLKAYHFDHIVTPGLLEHITARFGHINPSAKAFARKVAKKHGWKNDFALKALGEYKKFIYLGLVSDFEVTPSKIIDTVWHEHLLFTKAYRDFCTHVIEQPFDHHPELLPMSDQTGRFSAQYLDTINLYKTEFDIEPPVDIWGDTKFDKDELEKNGYHSKKKKSSSIDGGGDSSTPLHSHFGSESAAAYPEFTGYEGGDFGGGGSSGGWGDGGDSGSDGGGDGGGCSGGCGGGD
jgi:hypothetical protein